MQKENVVIKQRRHAELDSASSTHVVTQQNNNGERGRSRIKYGMTSLFDNGNNAFTLIELLVVVLIIGILAAVALPQYQKAVERARSREAISLLQSVYQAAKTYELSSGEWPDSFDELAVEIPWTGTEKWSTAGYIKDTRSNGTWSLQIYKDPSVALYKSIYLGRISGKYEGTGFNMNLNRAWTCVERTSTGKVFTGNAGDYCVKILHCSGSPSTTGDGRYYSAKNCTF